MMWSMISTRMLVALAMLCLGAALAQAGPSGAVYAGPSLEDPMVYLQLWWAEDGEVEVTLRASAASWRQAAEDARPEQDEDGRGAGSWDAHALRERLRVSRGGLRFGGTASVRDGELRAWVTSVPAWEERRGESGEPPSINLLLRAAIVEDARAPDPFGSLDLTLFGPEDLPPSRLQVQAVGTLFVGRAMLADGSFDVQRVAPFFYEAPWADLDLVEGVAGDVQESLRAGLDQRRRLPQGVGGRWADERIADVQAFGRSLVSVLYQSYTYSGGAHPNTFRESETFLRDGERWRRASLCEVLAELGHDCDRAALRQRIVRELRAQEAAWVVQGEVDAATPWLLETYSVTAHGLRFDFSPYRVGPYAQGPFVVRVPFDELGP